MKLLPRRGVLVEEEGSTDLTDVDADPDDAHALAAASGRMPPYRIAFGPRTRQKLFTVQGTVPRGA